MGFAGTDMIHHFDFLKSSENYRRYFIKELNDKHAYGGSKTGDWKWTVDSLYFRSVDTFEYKSANILAEQHHDSLEKYADSIGLAFQIKDDLLDHEGTMEKTGKKVGKDNAAGKATLVSLLGVENAKKRCLELCEEACDSLDFFGTKSEILKTAARFTIERGF